MSYGMAKGIRAALADGWRPRGGDYATADGCACVMGLWYAGAKRVGPSQHRKIDSDLIGGATGFFPRGDGHILEGLTVGFDGMDPIAPRHRQAWHRRYMSGYRAGRRLRKILIGEG